MKKINISKILGIVLITAGILVFLSPELAHSLQIAQTKAFITTYEKKYGQNESVDAEGKDESDNGENIAAVKEENQVYQTIVSYNQSIYLDAQSGFSDPWSYEQSPVSLDGFEDGVFGYIEIPSMGQTFELYIGATMENMSKGVAVMGQTSLPIGGENTNCVIAGHRGYNRSRTFFKDIEDIRIGDMVYIRNPWEKLTYRVESIDIIEPDNLDAVRIQEGKDMVTLLTCHPYASHGRYRYLVYCIRSESDAEENETEEMSSYGKENEKGYEYSDYIVASDGAIYLSSKREIEKETMFRQACIGLLLLLIFLILIRTVVSGQKKDEKKIGKRRGKS